MLKKPPASLPTAAGPFLARSPSRTRMSAMLPTRATWMSVRRRAPVPSSERNYFAATSRRYQLRIAKCNDDGSAGRKNEIGNRTNLIGCQAPASPGHSDEALATEAAAADYFLRPVSAQRMICARLFRSRQWRTSPLGRVFGPRVPIRALDVVLPAVLAFDRALALTGV